MILLCFQVPQRAVSAAEALLHSDNPKVKDGVLSTEVLSSATEKVKNRGRINHELYNNLVSSIVQHLESGTL